MLLRVMTALVTVLALSVSQTSAAQLLVLHGWSSPAEIAALNVLRAGLEAKGHNWINLAIPHDNGVKVNVIDLIAGGNSPNIFMEPNPQIYRQLREQGHALSPGPLFKSIGALDHFPQAVIDAITIDGQIMKVPNTIHADGVIYYNRAVAAASGVDPQRWTSLDAMFADFDRVRAAGYLPMAIGGQEWQVGYLTHALVASIGGAKLYRQLYSTQPDAAGFDDPALLQVFDTLRKIRQQADPAADGRDWNVATSLVISGKALLQLQGDWMKGEWHAAGKKIDVDFGCRGIPASKAMAVSIDGWGLLGGATPEVEQAELDFAAMAVDPKIQADFAAAKGSTPVRLDVAQSAVDSCSAQVLTALNTPGFAVNTPNTTASAAWIAKVWSVAFRFWNTPDMSSADAVVALRESFAALPG